MTRENQFFQGYYDRATPISGSEYDVVYSFFLSKTSGEKSAALELTASLIEVSGNRGVRPLALLEQFQKYNSTDDFRSALYGLFNSSRPSDSRIGYQSSNNSNLTLTRNVRR